ncbi:TPA: hypothetical protein KRI65_001581 [Clostridioides difficile]|uniref:hypothetical protein n=1 Tax=Clostridioides difficile TaxID=1496 RepID=UPI00148338BD|nr:hypothetical protein [Clostridioides difficile]EIS9701031.1 hypothetical protein [Clostridioides difficile]EIS9887217.1 hypothetical protein [Clostridioides difficile]EJA6404345.1 hypothetical protein [Clostridioides difficile]MBG0160457.1 hypothetical protein [Clostridioides difficile]MBN5920077.1 hypothetical protein [Clostridioides difficile]
MSIVISNKNVLTIKRNYKFLVNIVFKDIINSACFSGSGLFLALFIVVCISTMASATEMPCARATIFNRYFVSRFLNPIIYMTHFLI